MPEETNNIQQKMLDEKAEQLKKQETIIKKLKRNNIIAAVTIVILLVIFIIICTFSIYRRADEKIIYDKPTTTDGGQTPIKDDGQPQKDDNQIQTPTSFDGSELPTNKYGFYISKNDNGNKILLDRFGKVIEVDENGVPIIYDQNGKRIPTDENGILIVYDENGNRIEPSKLCSMVYRDQNGRAVVHSGKSNAGNENNDKSSDGSGHFTIYSNGDVYTADNGSSTLSCDIRNTDDSTHDIVVSIYISTDEMQAHGIDTNGVDGDKWLLAQSGLFEPGYQINSIQLNPLPDGSYLSAGSYALTMNEKYYHHETGVLASYEANIPVTLEVAN